MKFTLSLECDTTDLICHAYKYADSKELTTILRRVSAPGIDDFLSLKCFKVGNLKYAYRKGQISLKVFDENNNIIYLNDEWKPNTSDFDDWVDCSIADVLFEESIGFREPPKEYNRLIVERTGYHAIHKYSVDIDSAFDINRLTALKAPFRSFTYVSGVNDDILLDGLQYKDDKLRYLVERIDTNVTETYSDKYRSACFEKLRLPNEDEIALEDIRFDYFDIWKNF